jgi:hypothetical protein
MLNFFVRYFSMLITLAGIAFWFTWYRQNKKDNLYYALGYLVLLSHILIFLTVTLLSAYKVIIINPLSVNTWSLIIRLQTVITVTSHGLTLLLVGKYKNGKDKS